MTEGTFTHFPKETITFFKELENNNNKEWFQSHKQDYVDNVQSPAIDFITSMGERLKAISAGIIYDTRTNGAGSLMRIYRDIRFSPDKTPYKTNLGIVFWEGEGKKMENPGYYFHLDTKGTGFYAGFYMIPKDKLKTFRNAVDVNGAELQEAIDEIQSKGYTVGGDKYKRVPQGFDADHPHAELLKYKGLHSSTGALDPEIITSPDFIDICFTHWQNQYPLHAWLVSAFK